MKTPQQIKNEVEKNNEHPYRIEWFMVWITGIIFLILIGIGFLLGRLII